MLKLSDINLIGFSLGAHIAGIGSEKQFWCNKVWNKLQNMLQFSRKKGAFRKYSQYHWFGSSQFIVSEPNSRLDCKDSIYVETIHTSTLGFFQPLETVNLYPNGGRFRSFHFDCNCKSVQERLEFCKSKNQILKPVSTRDLVKMLLFEF